MRESEDPKNQLQVWSGPNYGVMAHDEATKNHPGGIANVSSIAKLARMNKTEEQVIFPTSKKEFNFHDIWYEAHQLELTYLTPQ